MVWLVQLVYNLSQEIANFLSPGVSKVTLLTLYLRIIDTWYMNILFILTEFTIGAVAVIEGLATAC